MGSPDIQPKPSTSSPITENELQHHSQELGSFGRMFGSKENAPVYFAGMLAVLSLLGALGVGIFSSGNDKADLVKALLAIVVAALSFLGGVSVDQIECNGF